MPAEPCIGPAASLYRERFDLVRHPGMSVLTFRGSRGSEGVLGKLQSSLSDPLWYTTHGMLVPCATRTAITTKQKRSGYSMSRSLQIRYKTFTDTHIPCNTNTKGLKIVLICNLVNM